MAGALALSFETELAPLEAELRGWARERIPSITRDALNATVVEAREAEQDKIRGVFDRPTPLTQRAPLYRRATKEDLVAAVYVNDEGPRQVRWLRPEIEGGPRPHKPFELRLIRAGVMRPDEYAIPAIGYARNAYGNLPGPLLERILSQLQAAAGAGYLANETVRSRKRNRGRVAARYFVPAGVRQERGISRLPRGVYERRGKAIRAVLIFVSGAPSYRRRYDFGQATIARASRVFVPYWERRFYAELAKVGGGGGGSLRLAG